MRNNFRQDCRRRIPAPGGTGDYYSLLGVRPEAGADEIKRAYRRRLRDLRPDLAKGAGSATAFQRVRRAYEVLSQAEARRRCAATRMKGDDTARAEFYRRSFGMLFDNLLTGLHGVVERAVPGQSGRNDR